MILQAIIGRKNRKISIFAGHNIASVLAERNAITDNIYDTNLNRVNDAINETIHPVFGKNLFVNVKNLTDPQEFYQCLSQRGYALVDSQLIQDVKLKNN